MPDLHELSHDECVDLLRSGVAGRVALSTPDGPHIIPVNYSVVDDAIIVRTSPYSMLGTYGRDTTLAFEVDHIDHENQRGWSVLVRGRADVVQDSDELEHIREQWEPRPWATGVRSLFVRLRWNELTGRRLGSGWDPAMSTPVRRML
ncbi:pyridoxamine 5'-phosphate oxidase family protein [Nocardioides sp. GCM10027113]|uniref:pyridoxamine 5'-phosphate oxidase family protein n=1 Tax=unclassified Nocardioides TaxID=2615069 RepID=UPI0036154429